MDAAMAAAVDVIGIDHVYLTVASLERSEAWYDRVLHQVLGFRKNRFLLTGDPHVQYYNRMLGIVLRPARVAASGNDRYAPGLHHLCLRVNEAADVDRAAKALAARGVEILSPARLYPEYAPDYYAVFVDDPDGLRLEVTNFRIERRQRMERWDTEEA
jgi:catechol 2,3-dioxygenase-like lactoylglutathione lyase family enzyme